MKYLTLNLNYPVLSRPRELTAEYEVGAVLPAMIAIDREGKARGHILVL